MAYSGYQTFEKVAPGSGLHGAAYGLITERLAHTQIAASEIAGAAIFANMAALGVGATIDPMDFSPEALTTRITSGEDLIPEIPGTVGPIINFFANLLGGFAQT